MRTQEWTYKRTHPWIKFSVDLRPASPALWMNLGEARSKFEHIAGVPLRPDVASNLHDIYLAKGVHGTTAIEGNTLSEVEIRKHMDGQLKLPLSQSYLQQEVDNIITACNQIARELWELNPGTPPPKLTPDRIKQFNRLVLKNLTLDTGEPAGEIRLSSVGVGPYLGAPAGECEHLLEKLCEWLESNDFKGQGNKSIVTAILKAILAHLYIAWIHPFPDGNGRTARLIEFQILTCAGVPSLAAQLLSNHYNKTRTEYYRQLDAASKSGGDVIPFIEYAVSGLIDGLVKQLHEIRAFQWEITWQNVVHGKFGHKNQMSESELRQHHLVLDISEKGEDVPFDKLREVSPRITLAYARKSNKTLRRDINRLIELNLIEENKKIISAKRGQILAFLPPRCLSASSDSNESQPPSLQSPNVDLPTKLTP